MSWSAKGLGLDAVFHLTTWTDAQKIIKGGLLPGGGQACAGAEAPFPDRNSLLVKITSSVYNDAGIQLVGWGEAGQCGPPEPVASAIEHVLAPRILGQQVCPTKVSFSDMHYIALQLAYDSNMGR